MKTNSISMFKKVTLVGLCILVVSCNLFNAKHKPQKAEKSALVIINDISKSNKLKTCDFEKETVWLKKYFHSNFTPNSDVVLMAIDNSSGSSLNGKEFLWKSSQAKQQEDYKSETDQMMQDAQLETDNLIQIAQTQKLILQELENQFHGMTTNQSKIIEMIPQLETIIKKGKYNNVKIIFISDMCQSSPRRSINSHNLKLKQEAERLAMLDAMALQREFSISKSALEKVTSITVLVPNKTNDTYEILPFYFQEFYGYFGYKKPIIWESL